MWRSHGLWAAALLSALLAPTARAQAEPAATPPAQADLEGARRLFAQSLREEQSAHYAVALDGFQRVRAVRETAPVDYHLGICLEALGQLANALSAYKAAARLGEGERAMAEVTKASNEHVEDLTKRVAVLTLTPSSRAPASAEVHVDGAEVPARGDVVLDPGHHHVHAVAPGVAPFDSDITLPPGGSASVELALDPPVVAPTPATPEPPSPAPAPPAADGGWRTAGWIAVGTGGLLLAASLTSLALRESDIATANRLCPGGGCTGGIDGDALAATDRARVEGPLGWTLGGAALVAFAAGAYLVVSAPHAALVATPTAGPHGAGVALEGAF